MGAEEVLVAILALIKKGLALIAALCTGFTLGLTAPAWAGWD